MVNRERTMTKHKKSLTPKEVISKIKNSLRQQQKSELNSKEPYVSLSSILCFCDETIDIKVQDEVKETLADTLFKNATTIHFSLNNIGYHLMCNTEEFLSLDADHKVQITITNPDNLPVKLASKDGAETSVRNLTTQLALKEGEIIYERLVYGKILVSYSTDIETAIEKIKYDLNHGSAGIGRIYDFDTKTVWSTTELEGTQKGFENKLVCEHFEEATCH
jgi:hypothetical protein